MRYLFLNFTTLLLAISLKILFFRGIAVARLVHFVLLPLMLTGVAYISIGLINVVITKNYRLKYTSIDNDPIQKRYWLSWLSGIVWLGLTGAWFGYDSFGFEYKHIISSALFTTIYLSGFEVFRLSTLFLAIKLAETYQNQ
jgi:hypothetical protein